MSLLKLSFTGAILIFVVVVIRAITINRLPKKTFLLLWEIALFRLLVPFSVPSRFSIYSFIGQHTPANLSAIARPTGESSLSPAAPVTLARSILNALPHLSIWFPLWGVGFLTLLIAFTAIFLRWHFEKQTSLPVENDFLSEWLAVHPLERKLRIHQSNRVASPLTYGILRPVILMPQDTDWKDTQQLQYILYHEYTHIRHFDTLKKLLFTLALCIHWFNPLVWIMYFLFNRDIELCCDEAVIRTFGPDSRHAYAYTLISIEERKSGLNPLCNNFNQNAIEERIIAIMKMKKINLLSLVFAFFCVIGIAVIFATSPQTQKETPSTMDTSENSETSKDSETSENSDMETELAQNTIETNPNLHVIISYQDIEEELCTASENAYYLIVKADDNEWTSCWIPNDVPDFLKQTITYVGPMCVSVTYVNPPCVDLTYIDSADSSSR